jgi:hypothetical protein
MMFKGIKTALLDQVPPTAPVVHLTPHDPDLPPPALHGTWRECKQHQRVIADIEARMGNARGIRDEAIAQADQTIRHAERELAEERAKLDAAHERWLMMTAELGIDFGLGDEK